MAHFIYRYVGIGTLLLFVLMPSRMIGQLRDSYEQCFAETGYCLQGRFLDYWQRNGGLAEFGFPIDAAHDERNADTGATYRTQWFERNRFELHPENNAPFDVLLGRLGDDVLRTQGRDWRAAPVARPKDGCLWVAQTAHNICDQGSGVGFRTYWSTHGLNIPALSAYDRSVALFGLPLTEAAMERNASGDTVLTQWFERARLEWHPQNPAPYRVQLGLLGAELRNGPTTGALQYMWPEVLPLGLVVQRGLANSFATESDFTLKLDSGGQFFATISGGPGSEAPQRPNLQTVSVRGQRGTAFTTGAGFSVFWIEAGQPYAIRGSLPLVETLQLAEGLSPQSLAMWNSLVHGMP